MAIDICRSTASDCLHVENVMFNLERASTHGHTKAIKEGDLQFLVRSCVIISASTPATCQMTPRTGNQADDKLVKFEMIHN